MQTVSGQGRWRTILPSALATYTWVRACDIGIGDEHYFDNAHAVGVPFGLGWTGGSSFAPRSRAQNAPPIPEFSGHWSRTNFNLEQPESGPRFIANTLKKPDGTIDDDTARVGDYTNPILTLEGARILREHGELSRTGKAISDPHNQC